MVTKGEWGYSVVAGVVDGCPKVPSGSPIPLVPYRMKNFDEVAKGLGGFVNLWDTMANEDIFGEFKRQNEPLSYYWSDGCSNYVTDGCSDFRPADLIERVLSIFKICACC